MMNNKIRKVALTLAVGAGVLATSAKTFYVRSGLPDYTGHNGDSWDLAYETIQEAVNRAANWESGQTILVHAGVYDKGVGRTGHWWGKARVNVNWNDKDITIRSCKGTNAVDEATIDPEHTIIMGADDPTGGAEGFGPDAVRCIQIEAKLVSTNKIVFQGFTLKGGRTANRGDSPGYGGALQNSQDGNNATHNAYLVDCIITNCQAATCPVSVGGTLVRCRIENGDFVVPPCKTATDGVWLMYGTYCLNCLFRHNTHVDATTREVVNPHGTGIYFAQYCRLVNCSLVDNRSLFWNCSPTRWYNSVISSSYLPPNDGATHTNRFDDTVSKAALIAPTLGDYRVRKDGGADTAGDAEYLADESIIPLPATVDRFRDIDGNPIPTTGTICAGCSQAVVEPVGGKVWSEDFRTYFDDTTNACSAAGAVYAWPTNYPVNYRVRMAYLNDNGSVCKSDLEVLEWWVAGWPRAPSWHSSDIYVTPKRDAATSTKIEMTLVTKIAYAKPDADPDLADGSYAHPYPTLQQAYEKYRSEGAILRAFPGVYDKPVTTNYTGNPVILSLPVGKVTRVVAMEGPEKTFVVGAPDPDTKGFGPKATMLISMVGRTHLTGFTLTGGWSGEAVSSYDGGRRPIYSYGRDLHLVDCVITNNHGANYAMGCGRFERCLIADNYGKDAIFISPLLSSCIVMNNHLSSSSGVFCREEGADFWAMYLYNSTLVGDGVHPLINCYNSYSVRQNCIFDRGAADIPSKGTNRGSVYYGFSAMENVGENVIGNPMLSADGTPFAQSPALTAGVMTEGNTYEVQTDFAGRRLTYKNGGKAAYAGAVQDYATGGVYIGQGSGGIAVTGADFGFTAREDFTGATISMVKGSVRPLGGLIVNGVTNIFDETHTTYTITAAQAAAGDVGVVPFYTSDWYVDADKGDDEANSGYNAGNAFRTLARALTNAYLVAGDRVVALPGYYNEGVVSNSTTVVPTRAVVKSGVTLVARDGAEQTFIMGRASEVPAYYVGKSYSEAARAGLGPDAIRSVYLDSTATVKGFTITNGFTFGFSTTGSGEHSGQRCNGGNVAGYGTVEDCVIAGGKAFRGGGTYHTKAVRCIFDGNASLYGGGASSDAKHYGCLSRNNTCAGNAFWGGFFFWTACENCTCLDSLGGPGGNGYFLRNALVLGHLGSWDYVTDKYHAADGHHFTNCVIAVTGSGQMNTAYYQQCVRAGGHCIVTNLAALVVDAKGCPVIGQNVAIDAGDAAVAPDLAATDMAGTQRIYNGQIDAGAYEADWRAKYARDIGPRFAVETADPSIVETAKGDVRLIDETRLVVRVLRAPAGIKTLKVKATVSGAGTLTVLVNGEVAATMKAGAQEVDVQLLNPTVDELVFTYAGEGYADLDRASIPTGFKIFVQ